MLKRNQNSFSRLQSEILSLLIRHNRVTKSSPTLRYILIQKMVVKKWHDFIYFYLTSCSLKITVVYGRQEKKVFNHVPKDPFQDLNWTYIFVSLFFRFYIGEPNALKSFLGFPDKHRSMCNTISKCRSNAILCDGKRQ